MKQFLVLVCFCIVSQLSFANEGNGIIKGKVFTNEGKSAADVTIVVKGKSRATSTNDDGTFILKNLPAGNYELEISLIGYQTTTEEVSIGDNDIKEVTINLQLSEQELKEVIVRSGSKSYKANTVSSSLRIQTPILELPQNVQVVTGKALADQHIISMSDGVTRNVSGTVRMEHWGDLYTNITSRGAQVQAFRNGFNVVNSFWGPLTEDMSYVDHIEFVKGPAGFMLASGDPSGLYNVVTKKPTGQTKGEVSFTGGSFDLYRTTLDLDGKLSQDGRLLYRLNLAGQQKKSFRAFEFNDRYSVAPVLSYQLDPKTKLTLEYTYQRANMSNLGSYYVFSTDGYATLPRDFTFLSPGLPATHIDDHSIFLNLQHQLSDKWKFTAQGAYFNYYQNGSSMWPGSVNTNGKIIRGVSSWEAKSKMTMLQGFVNGDINTGLVRHRILAGVDVANKDYYADWGQYHELDTAGAEFDTHNPNYGIPVNGYPKFDYSSSLEQRAIAVGGLMDLSYSSAYLQDELGFLNNTIRLTLAGRSTYLKQSQWGGASTDANHFTPRIGLSVSLDKETSVYGLYDQAFIPQSGRLAEGGNVKPITGNNMEIGLKRDWFGGKWNTSLAAYRILKNNELTADPNSPPTSGLSVVFGQKRSQGLEFDLRGKITEGLSVIANYAYTQSKVTEVAKDVTIFKEGDILPGYATHTANAWLNYKVNDGVLKGAGVSGGFTWLLDRKTYWDPSPEGGALLPDYFKLDGGLFWEKGKMKITANVFNILDKYLYTGSYYAYLKAYYWQADPPRNFRLGISYGF